ncbi:unnamed protein product, partial [Brenthis ino]
MRVTTSLLGAILIRVLTKRADGCKRVHEGARGRLGGRLEGARVQVHLGGGRRPAAHVPGPAVAREPPSKRRYRPRPPSDATGGAARLRAQLDLPVYTPGSKHQTFSA